MLEVLQKKTDWVLRKVVTKAQRKEEEEFACLAMALSRGNRGSSEGFSVGSDSHFFGTSSGW